MNVVADDGTRRLAEKLIHEARRETGPDAILNHLDHLEQLGDQTPALVGVLLSHIALALPSLPPPGTPRRPAHRPRTPFMFSPTQRRRGHAAYRRGDRSPETIAREREYQAANQRDRRARKAS